MAFRGKSLAEIAASRRLATTRQRPDEDRWKPSLARFLQPAQAHWLHRPYASVGGLLHDLPVLVTEIQNDHVQSHGATNVMKRLAEYCARETREHDARRNENAAPRLLVNRQRKYRMRHDGSYGGHAERKAVAVRVATALLERYCATPLLEFLDRVREAGHKLDDLCDALLLAVQTGIEFYALAAKAHDAKARPLRRGACVPGGGSLRVHAIDAGTRHYAQCTIEVRELLPPPVAHAADDMEKEEEESGGAAGETDAPVTASDAELAAKTPDLVFRVLQWDLLDLLEDKVSASFEVAEADADVPDRAPFYRPAVRDIGAMFAAAATTAPVSATATKRKRSKASDGDSGARKKRRTTGTKPRVTVLDLTGEDHDGNRVSD